jgi:lysophospholipase L1-like esterase
MSLTVKIALSPLAGGAGRAHAPAHAAPARAQRASAKAWPAQPAATPLRLLIAGDSSAAGVGVVHPARGPGRATGRPPGAGLRARVHWRLVARPGLTTAGPCTCCSAKRPPQADVVVMVTGVNDVVDQVPSHRAICAREALANWLRNTQSVQHVAFAPLPPVHHFPGLPQPLRWVAGADAQRHNARWSAGPAHAGRCVQRGHANAAQDGLMAVDGFHPGAAAYRYCATAIAQHMATQRVAQLQLKETMNGPMSSLQGKTLRHHRRQPRHRPGHRQARGGRRRQHRAAGQDGGPQPQAARHAGQRCGRGGGGRRPGPAGADRHPRRRRGRCGGGRRRWRTLAASTSWSTTPAPSASRPRRPRR